MKISLEYTGGIPVLRNASRHVRLGLRSFVPQLHIKCSVEIDRYSDRSIPMAVQSDPDSLSTPLVYAFYDDDGANPHINLQCKEIL